MNTPPVGLFSDVLRHLHWCISCTHGIISNKTTAYNLFRVIHYVTHTVYMLQMISIDSSNKLKVITKEPGTADGSSMLSVKGVTIIQGNKATVMSQPTPKIITTSGIATGSRPPVKYIFSTGQVRKYQNYIPNTFLGI